MGDMPLHVRHLCPPKKFQPAVEMLDQRRATFDPVAVVAIENAVDAPDLGAVDVAADDSVDTAAACFRDHRLLVVADVLDGVLDFVLQVRGERPVGEAEPAADHVEPQIGREREVVGAVAGERQPLGILDDAVELIAVQDEKPPPVRGYMHGFGQDGDAAEPVSGEIPEILVMIAGDVDDARSLARLAQELLDDVVVVLAPVPGAPHPPDIDDVADEVEIMRLGRAKEIQEKLGIASSVPRCTSDIQIERYR